MRHLRIRQMARAEIHEAFDWYRSRSPDAAARFIDAVDLAIRAIETTPEQHGPFHGNLRRRLLAGFPYGIYFRVYPTVISVVGVIHGSRHPDTWLQRAEP